MSRNVCDALSSAEEALEAERRLAAQVREAQEELRYLRAWAEADIDLFNDSTPEKWERRERARKVVHAFYAARTVVG